MKTLEEFDLIREFLGAQGIKPTVAMICADSREWQDLVMLARDWRNSRDEAAKQQEEELANLSEDELALRDKEARERELVANDEIVYHSCGTDAQAVHKARKEKHNV